MFYFPGGLSNPAYVRDLYDTGDDGGDDAFDAEPTATEKTLPWLRKDDEDQAICQVNMSFFYVVVKTAAERRTLESKFQYSAKVKNGWRN